MISLVRKFLIELQKFQTIQKQLYMKKIPKERYISPEERQKTIDDLRLA